MKSRLLGGILLLAVGLIALGLYLMAGRNESAVGPMKSAHRQGAGPMSGSPHDKNMLSMALEKNPRHVPVLLKLAQIESEDGHLQDASTHLRRALEAEPDNRNTRLEFGKVLFQLGDVRGAIEHTAAILKNNPADEDALYNMGAIQANLGNAKSAMQYWNRLIALNSDSESAERARQMMNRLITNHP